MTGRAVMGAAAARLAVTVSVWSALAVVPQVARVARAGEPALAETLYQDGRTLMAQGRTAEACAKFEESLRLDQATGTLLNLAVCHEALGKLATAWAEFRAAAASASHDGRGDRTRLARDHLNNIEPRLSRLTIVVPTAARVAGLHITLDGTTLGEPAWNAATPVDPGTHVVNATAPGYAPWSRNLMVGMTAVELKVPVALVPAVEPTRTGAGLPAKPPAEALPPSGTASASTEATTPRPGNTPAYIVTGVGVAALAVGAVFGARALSKWSDRNRECPMDACSDAGLTASGQAETAALSADIAVGAGLVAVAVGAYLFYRAHARAAGGGGGGAASTASRSGGSWKLTRPWSGGVASGGVAMGWSW